MAYKRGTLRFEVYDGDELEEACEKEFEKLRDFEWRGVMNKYRPFINPAPKKRPMDSPRYFEGMADKPESSMTDTFTDESDANYRNKRMKRRTN